MSDHWDVLIEKRNAIVPVQRPGTAVTKREASSSRRNSSFYGIERGGYRNLSTGSGTASDKMRLGEVMPTRITDRNQLEVISTELIQVKKLIRVIAEDMVLRWREFETADSPDEGRTMMDQEKKFQVKNMIKELIQSARTYGTAMLIMKTKGSELDDELDPERMMPGDLSNLMLVDRFDLTPGPTTDDMDDPNFGKPEYYLWHAGTHGTHMVHHTRCLRYDCEKLSPRHGHGFSAYDQDWGIPVLVAVLLEVFRDEDAAASVQAQLLRSGTLVAQLDDLDERTSSRVGGGQEGTIQSAMDDLEAGVRSHRMVAVDSESAVEFLSPSFANLDKVLHYFQARLASAFDIPQTRLWGTSPQGMNATGESDMEQYSDMIGGRQESKLTPLMDQLDEVLALDAGMSIDKIPEYRWMPYRKKDENLEATTAKIIVESIGLAIQNRLMTEDEGRASLDGHPIFGDLPEWDGEPPFMDALVEEQMEQLQIEMQPMEEEDMEVKQQDEDEKEEDKEDDEEKKKKEQAK